MESVRPWSVLFEDYLIEYEQPEYLPSGKDCESYQSLSGRGGTPIRLWRLHEAAEISVEIV